MSEERLPVQIERFPGLRPYRTDERVLFFGREREAENLYYSVVGNKVTLLYGQSGSGKSSLINCTLLPSLAEDRVPVLRLRVHFDSGALTASGNLYYCDVSDDREIQFEIGLGDKAGQSIQALHDGLDETTDRKAEPTLAQDLLSSDQPFVFIIDQFEEVFDHLKIEQQRTLMNFLADLRRDKKYHWNLLLSLRGEYVGHLASLAEYIRGVFDSPIHVSPLSTAQAQRALAQVASTPQEGMVGGIPYRIVSPPFTITEDACKRVIDECVINSDFDGANLLLLQLIGQAIVAEFVRTGHTEDRVVVDNTQITADWLRRVKTKNVELLLSTTFKSTSDLNKATRVLEKMITEAGKRQIVRRSEVTDTSLDAVPPISEAAEHERPANMLDGLLRSGIVREERVFSDRRYEISHDFIADAIWRKALKRRKFRNVLLSLAGFAVFAVAVLASGRWVNDKQNEVEEKKEELLVLGAQKENIESQLEHARTQLREVQLARVAEQGEAADIAEFNCRLQVKVFRDSWQNAEWGNAYDNLTSTLTACEPGGALSVGAIKFLENIGQTAFASDVLTRSTTSRFQNPARPSFFVSESDVMTYELVGYALSGVDDESRSFEAIRNCSETQACDWQVPAKDIYAANLLDGSRVLLRTCELLDQQRELVNDATHYFTNVDCSADRIVKPASLASVRRFAHPLVVGFDTSAGSRFFAIGQQGTDLVCSEDGWCNELEGTGIQQAMVTSMVIGSRVSVDLRPAMDNDAVMFASDQGGYVYRYGLAIPDCVAPCSVRTTDIEAKLERFIKGHGDRINSLQLAEIGGNPVIFSASEDGTVTARDQRSLEMLSSFRSPDRTALEAIFVRDSGTDEAALLGLSANWTLLEWPIDEFLVDIHRVPQILPKAVEFGGAQSEHIYLAGRHETLDADGGSIGRPGVARVDGNRIVVDCDVQVREGKFMLSIERLAANRQRNAIVAGMADYKNRGGGIAVSTPDSDTCEFTQVARRKFGVHGGAIHSATFVSDRDYIAADFNGAVWRGTLDDESEAERFKLFSDNRKITTVDAHPVSGDLLFAVRRKLLGDGRVADVGCAFSVPKGRISSSSSISTCAGAVAFGAAIMRPEVSAQTLRWAAWNPSNSKATVSGNKFATQVGFGEEVTSVPMQTDSIVVWRAEYINDGDVLVGATYEGTLEFWDAESGLSLLSVRLPATDKGTNALLDLATSCDSTAEIPCKIAVPLKNERAIARLSLRGT